MEYEASIGLKIHAQLRTESKLFCGCPTRFGDPPNENTCPVCLGLPGTLPALNRKAVELAVQAALGLHCRVEGRSVLVRSSQDPAEDPGSAAGERPLATGGFCEIPTEEGPRRVRILRVHLEEDPGSPWTETPPDSLLNASMDFNRCGVPLLEIVTGPDLRTPKEARAFLQALKSVLACLRVYDGHMGREGLRCDAVVSVGSPEAEGQGARVEIRGLGSSRMVEKALEHEVHRQADCLRNGQPVGTGARFWDDRAGTTRPLGTSGREAAGRRLPEPDLLPLDVAPGWEQAIRNRLPELPDQKRARFVRQYGLPEYDAGVLTLHPSLAGYFEEAARGTEDPKAVSGWVMTEVLRVLKGFAEEPDEAVDSLRVRPAHVAALVSLVQSGAISPPVAREVFQEVARTGDDPKRIVEKRGLAPIREDAELRRLVRQVVADNAAVVADCRAGSEKAFHYLVGQAMERSGGQANPPRLNGILKELLG